MDRQITTLEAKIPGGSYAVYSGKNILESVSLEKCKAEHVAFIISENVYALHKEKINAFVARVSEVNQLESKILFMDDKEENKSYDYAKQFLEELISLGFTRRSLIIGIGGGVVGDFCGYIAALFMRGISVIHMPTTLLAMVDSSIGGKVAVNLSLGKNIVGAFHQPKAVITDTAFLETLQENEFKNGLAEALKHGCIGETETMKIFSENTLDSIKKTNVITKLVEHSIAFKISVVEQDEKESGLRAILNYGHTIGHGIESLLEFKGISHGEAVSYGMIAETMVANRMQMLADDDNTAILDLVKKYQLVYSKISVDPEQVIDHMKYDKKNFEGKINFVLLKELGKPIINQQVDVSILLEVLNEVV